MYREWRRGFTKGVHKAYTTPTGTEPSRGIFLRKYRHGGREDTGLVHVAALLADLLFFMKRTCFDMTPIQRMIAVGMSEQCAAETAMWFMAQGDDDGLEDYISDLETSYAVRLLQSQSAG